VRSEYTSGGKANPLEIRATREYQVRGLPAVGRPATREKQPERDHSMECQPFGARERQSFVAIVTRSASESACIFRMRLPRCIFTVISLILSAPPICLFS